MSSSKTSAPTTSSRFRGVSKYGRRWCAQLRFGGRNYSLGTHDEEEGAARAFDAKAREFCIEERYTNFPVGLPPREGPPPLRFTVKPIGATDFRGVTMKKGCSRSLAQFYHGGKRFSSYHETPEAAARAWDEMARKAGRPEETLNFPRDGQPSAARAAAPTAAPASKPPSRRAAATAGPETHAAPSRRAAAKRRREPKPSSVTQ